MKALCRQCVTALFILLNLAPAAKANSVEDRTVDIGEFEIVYSEEDFNLNIGFYDARIPWNPDPSNDGATLGEQRRNVFEAAVKWWANRIVARGISIHATSSSFNCEHSDAGTISTIDVTTINTSTLGEPLSIPQSMAINIFYSQLKNEIQPSLPDFEITLNSSIGFVRTSDGFENLGCFNHSVFEDRRGKEFKIGLPTENEPHVHVYLQLIQQIGHGLGFGGDIKPHEGKFNSLHPDPFSKLVYSVDDDKSLADLMYGDNTNTPAAIAALSGEKKLIFAGSKTAAVACPDGANEGAQYLEQTDAEGESKYYPFIYTLGESTAGNFSNDFAAGTRWSALYMKPHDVMEPLNYTYPYLPISDRSLFTLAALADLGWQTSPSFSGKSRCSSIVPVLKLLILNED